MVDSTTVTVREALRADVPGTGASSALKGHTGSVPYLLIWVLVEE